MTFYPISDQNLETVTDLGSGDSTVPKQEGLTYLNEVDDETLWHPLWNFFILDQTDGTCNFYKTEKMYSRL